MRIDWKMGMGMVIVLLSMSCKTSEDRLEDAMRRAVAWLWAQQGEDGGWHSQTHAVLRDGRALSPYILYHLMILPEKKYERPKDGVEKGLAFIRREMETSMSMHPDSIMQLNYPNYSAAYALRVLRYADEDTALQQIIVDHLRREQFTAQRGIPPEHLAFGGWGYGEADLPYGQYGHVDLSHTRRITEALVEVGSDEDMKVTAESVTLFLKGVQRAMDDLRLYEGCISRKDLPYDGGFVSSAVTLSTNKSQPVFVENAGYHYASYATATCDGLMTMHALGLTDTQPYKDAKQWLDQHKDVHTIEGLNPEDPGQWHLVMHYYHLAVRAEAMHAAQISGSWAKDIRRILIQEQTDEGYYVNPAGGINKEDDPLMATILAVQAGVESKRE